MGNDDAIPPPDPPARAIVLEATEGPWLERPPPDQQPGVRVLRHGRRTAIREDRWARAGGPGGLPDPG
ncbi:MAG: hypothetical protein ACLF0G_13870 [Candidatus Brocadiia bacterium]